MLAARSRQHHRHCGSRALRRLRAAARRPGARAPQHPGAGRGRSRRRDRDDDRAQLAARSSCASTRRCRRRFRTRSSPPSASARAIQLLRLGGPLVLRFFLFAAAIAILQNVVGAAVALALGQEPLLGVLAGSVTLTGGPATGLAFAPLFEQAGVHGAATVAVAAAMAGIVCGGLDRRSPSRRCCSSAAAIAVPRRGPANGRRRPRASSRRRASSSRTSPSRRPARRPAKIPKRMCS